VAALGARLADDAALFADVAGRPWRPDVFTNRFARLRDGLGLQRVRLHDLRHFVATELGDGGVPIATISKRLGHRDVSTTLNIYTHVLDVAPHRHHVGRVGPSGLPTDCQPADSSRRGQPPGL
jgi:integrase